MKNTADTLLRGDNHCHTNISDGGQSWEVLLEEAKKRGMSVLNYTDHDRFATQDMIQASNDAGIVTYHSSEISACNYNGDKPKSLHVTCYLGSESSELIAVGKNTIDKKTELITKQFNKVVKYGFRGDINEFYRYYGIDRNLDMLNKYDIAKYILTKPRNKFMVADLFGNDILSEIDPADILKKCLQPGGQYYEDFGVQVPYYEPSVEHIGSLVEKKGGILSIAHPNFSFADIGPEGFEKIFPQYHEMGVNAIEISSFADIRWLSVIYRLAEKYNLTLTIGSDNHMLGKQDKTHADFGELNPVIISIEGEVDRILRGMIDHVEG